MDSYFPHFYAIFSLSSFFTAPIHVTALTVIQVFSAKRIGMNVGQDPVKMVVRVSMAWPITIVHVQMGFRVSCGTFCI